MKKHALISLGIISLGLILVSGPVLAVEIPNPLSYDTFEELIDAITNFIFYVAVALAPLMVLIGAFYLMTAGGDAKRVQTAKNIFLYTAIGFLIVLAARGLFSLIRGILTG